MKRNKAGTRRATNVVESLGCQPDAIGRIRAAFPAYGFLRGAAVALVAGLGSIRGVLLGAAVLIGFDRVLSPLLTYLIQDQVGETSNVLLRFTNWKWILFGTSLILMMRYRPEGLWPSERVKAELHHEDGG